MSNVTQNAAFESIKNGLEAAHTKKFELEDIDLREEQNIIYVVEDVDGAYGARRKAIVLSYEPREDDMSVRSYSLESQLEVSRFVKQEDLMFEGPSNDGLAWKDYAQHVELLQYLAALAPNTNFAVELHELTSA